MENILFYNPTRGKISFDTMLMEIADFVLGDPKSVYKISVGTDSESSDLPEFVTAVTIHKVGRGGRFFITKFIDKNKAYHTLRQRIYQEIMLSLNLAMSLWPELQTRIQDFYPLRQDDLCIHLDIGNQGATREMIREMIGMVKGNGFGAEIKPESYAASIVADRYT